MYEQHPFWCTGYTFWELHNEAPDLFLHLSRSDLVFFKGDLNHRKLTYDCAAPPSTDFEIAIGPMASAAGAPKVCSLRTIKSDVVVGLGPDGDERAEKLDQDEPGWKISGKYVRLNPASAPSLFAPTFLPSSYDRPSSSCPRVVPARRSSSREVLPQSCSPCLREECLLYDIAIGLCAAVLCRHPRTCSVLTSLYPTPWPYAHPLIVSYHSLALYVVVCISPSRVPYVLCRSYPIIDALSTSLLSHSTQRYLSIREGCVFARTMRIYGPSMELMP